MRHTCFKFDQRPSADSRRIGVTLVEMAVILPILMTLILGALEIGAPLVGALLLAEVTLALGARFAPQANIFMVSLPFKAFVVFALMGNVLIYLPLYAERISERAVELVGAIG